MVSPPFYVWDNHIKRTFIIVAAAPLRCRDKKQNMPINTANSAYQISLMNISGLKTFAKEIDS